MTQARISGFTLVELMAVVVILAIIVGIAYPSYRNYMVQTRRSDAQVILTQVSHTEEKFFSSCSRYTTTMTGKMGDCDGSGGGGGLGFSNNSSPDGHYQVTIAGGTIAGAGTIANTYTATATPKAGGLQDGNGALHIDSTGVKEWNKPGAGWGPWTQK
jgi:type IV pilus assembly protein PilE